jgi:hypothetical protein
LRLRRLTAEGVARMSAFLDSLTTSTPEAPPYEILTDPAMSEPVPGDIEIEQRAFGCRLDVARYLDERFGDTETRGLERDRGVWSWLALLFFESLCPVGRDGRRKPGARARWIPEISNFQRYYRHLLGGPYLIYRAHGMIRNGRWCCSMGRRVSWGKL